MIYKFLGGVMTHVEQMVPALITTVLALVFPIGARAEVSLLGEAAVYGKVIKVSAERVITIEIESSYSGDTVELSAKLEKNDADPFGLAVLLEGRHVFCFPAPQATTEQYFQLATCFLQISDLPGFAENTNFISLPYVLRQMQAP